MLQTTVGGERGPLDSDGWIDRWKERIKLFLNNNDNPSADFTVDMEVPPSMEERRGRKRALSSNSSNLPPAKFEDIGSVDDEEEGDEKGDYYDCYSLSSDKSVSSSEMEDEEEFVDEEEEEDDDDDDDDSEGAPGAYEDVKNLPEPESANVDSDVNSNFEANSVVDYLSFDSADEDDSEDDEYEEYEGGLQLVPDFSKASEPVPSTSGANRRKNVYNFSPRRPDPPPPQIPFTGNQRLLATPSNISPLGFFEFLAEQAIDLAVRETNKHGETLKKDGKMKRFQPVDTAEMKKFLGIFFHIGFIRAYEIRDYWSPNKSLGNMYFYKKMKMSYNRFLQILRALHFNSGVGPLDTDEDPLVKIRPLLNLFNSKMDSVYSPGRELRIPEPLVLYHGRLVGRKLVKDTMDQAGVKMYSLLEPDGLVVKFHVHAGNWDKETGGGNCTSKVVHKLMERQKGKGHSLFLDSYYNSVKLVTNLLKENTYCTGPVNNDAKHFPKSVMNKRLKRSEMVQEFSDSNVCVLKWKGVHRSHFVSSEYTGDLSPWRDGCILPIAVGKYCKIINTYDYEHDTLPYYSCQRKILNWYTKIGLHMFQLMLLNSFYLYRRHTKKRISFYKFKLKVSEKLVIV